MKYINIQDLVLKKSVIGKLTQHPIIRAVWSNVIDNNPKTKRKLKFFHYVSTVRPQILT